MIRQVVFGFYVFFYRDMHTAEVVGTKHISGSFRGRAQYRSWGVRENLMVFIVDENARAILHSRLTSCFSWTVQLFWTKFSCTIQARLLVDLNYELVLSHHNYLIGQSWYFVYSRIAILIGQTTYLQIGYYLNHDSGKYLNMLSLMQSMQSYSRWFN